MFIIPIEESLLYVEPVYLEAVNSSLPEVKRVIVAYGDKIAYEATLSKALESLFGAEEEKPGIPGDVNGNGQDTSIQSLIEKAAKAYEDALAAQKEGRWADYGTHMQRLENYLTTLESLAGRDSYSEIPESVLIEE